MSWSSTLIEWNFNLKYVLFKFEIRNLYNDTVLDPLSGFYLVCFANSGMVSALIFFLNTCCSLYVQQEFMNSLYDKVLALSRMPRPAVNDR